MPVELEYDWAEDARKCYDLAISTLREELDKFPRVELGPCTLINADIRDVYHLLPKADCLVTDPPYRLTSGGNGNSDKHNPMKGGWLKDYTNNGSPVECDLEWDEVLKILYALCATNADVYCMANDKNLLPCLQAADAAGFGIHNILVWDKVTATANRWYMKNLEFTAYLWKGRAQKINDCGSKQLVRLHQKDETTHPTEKPVPLMEVYISNSSKAGQLILDPFMGSGTTGIAALNLGRRFLGVEKTKEFFDMAVNRLQEAAHKVRLI